MKFCGYYNKFIGGRNTIFYLILVSTFLISNVQGGPLISTNHQACIDLCASCNGVVSFVNNRCVCNLDDDKDKGAACIMRMKREAKGRGFNVISCNAPRCARCALEDDGYTEEDYEQIAQYFTQGGPSMLGSVFVAPSFTSDNKKKIVQPKETLQSSENVKSSNNDEIVSKSLDTDDDCPEEEEPETPVAASNDPEQVASPQSNAKTPNANAKKDFVARQIITQPEETVDDSDGENPTVEVESKSSCNCNPAGSQSGSNQNDPIVGAPLATTATKFLLDIRKQFTESVLGIPKALDNVRKSEQFGSIMKAPASLLNAFMKQLTAGELVAMETPKGSSDSSADSTDQPDNAETDENDPIVGVSNVLGDFSDENDTNSDETTETPRVNLEVTTKMDVEESTKMNQEKTKQGKPEETTQIDEEVVAEVNPEVTTSRNLEETTQIDEEVVAEVNPEVTTSRNLKETTQIDEEVVAEVEPEITTQANPDVTTQADPDVVTEMDEIVGARADPELEEDVDAPSSNSNQDDPLVSNPSNTDCGNSGPTHVKLLNPNLGILPSTHIYLPLTMIHTPMQGNIAPMKNMQQLPMATYIIGPSLGMPYYHNFDTNTPSFGENNDNFGLLTTESKDVEVAMNKQKRMYKKFIRYPFFKKKVIRDVKTVSESVPEETSLMFNDKRTNETENKKQHNDNDILKIPKVERTTTSSPFVEQLRQKINMEKIAQIKQANIVRDKLEEITKSSTERSKLIINPIKKIIRKQKGQKKVFV